MHKTKRGKTCKVTSSASKCLFHKGKRGRRKRSRRSRR